MTQPFLY